MIGRLRDELEGAKGATDMFRTFSHYNSVFVRPRIRSAVKQYQVC